MVRKISWEKFQKIRKLLNFQKANHSTENSGNFGMKVKWKGNFHERKFENLGIPHEVVFFFGIYAKFQLTTQRELVLLVASQPVGHLTRELRRRAFDKRNTLEPFYLYADKY